MIRCKIALYCLILVPVLSAVVNADLLSIDLGNDCPVIRPINFDLGRLQFGGTISINPDPVLACWQLDDGVEIQNGSLSGGEISGGVLQLFGNIVFVPPLLYDDINGGQLDEGQGQTSASDSSTCSICWSGTYNQVTVVGQAIPEPGTLAMLVVGLLGVLGYAGKKRLEM